MLSRKGAELDHIVLLNTNRKSYMSSENVPVALTLSDLKGPSSTSHMLQTYLGEHDQMLLFGEVRWLSG